MSKLLEDKIIELIDDYIENGLTVTVKSNHSDGMHWISFADSLDAPLIRALIEIAESIKDHDMSNSIDRVADAIENADIDKQGDTGAIYDHLNYPPLAHPLSAIAYALCKLSGIDDPYTVSDRPTSLKIQNVDKDNQGGKR